jgi:predicted nucleic acid-binding protein
VTVVDTSVWIDFRRGVLNKQTKWLLENMGDPGISLTDLTLSEVLQGESTEAAFEEARRALLHLVVHSTGGAELAIESANHYRMLRKRGATIRSTIDCLIATFCIRGGHFLLHNDRDFDPFEKHLGLKVIRP